MSDPNEEMMETIAEIEAQIDELEREIASDPNDDDTAELAQIEELRQMIAGIHEEQRLRFLSGEGSEPPVQEIDVEGGLEFEVPDPRTAGNVRFDAKRGDFIGGFSRWRNSCKGEIETLVSAMLEADNDGEEIPRGDLISLLSTALDVAQVDPRVGMVIGTVNTLYDVVSTAYRSTLPRQPSLREAQQHWSDAFEQMRDDRIAAKYPEVELAFKRANGIPDDDEWVLPSFQSDWNSFIDLFCEGRMLPRARDIRRRFMTTVLRAMPDSIWDGDLTSGHVNCHLDYDHERGTFSFDSGEIDDLTDEARRGLSRLPNLYGPNITDLPLIIEFCIHSSSWEDFGNSIVCDIRRASQTSGSTDFRLSMRPGSPLSLDEQTRVMENFMSARPYQGIRVQSVL